MRYLKPTLTFDQQADLLLTRGLEADRGVLISTLQSVNYYRLSGYLYPFRIPGGDAFRSGTRLEQVWTQYRFDRQLRLLLLDAIERFEVSLKTELTYRLAHRSGPFGYRDASSFAACSTASHGKILTKLQEEVSRSREVFLQHFQAKYGDVHGLPPLWMTAEVLSLGTTLSLFRILEPSLKQDIAKAFGVHDRVFESWITALNALRNICAHHGRVWNREFGYKPLIPNKDPAWRGIGNERLFGMLCILSHLLRRIAPRSGWYERMETLIEANPRIPRLSMGMPANWTEHPLWKTTP
ncbi:MAG: Abi family protein [Fibrobacteres bacterium]|nr:Abi family protein [Fibrobacterota bacterium]